MADCLADKRIAHKIYMRAYRAKNAEKINARRRQRKGNRIQENV